MLFQWKWYIYLINDILSTINCNFGYKVQNIETEIMMNCCNRGNISDKGKTVKYFLLAQLPTWSTQVGQETCFCTSHQEGMISMWKENTVADVPLQKHTIKSNLITHHLRIYSIVTDAVCTALTWPGHGLQPRTNPGDVIAAADVFRFLTPGLFGCRPRKYQIESKLRLKINFNDVLTVDKGIWNLFLTVILYYTVIRH